MRSGVWSRVRTASMAVSQFAADLSLFHKIFYGITLIVFLIIAVSGAISYTYSKSVYEREAAESAMKLAENINTSFEDNLEQVDRIISSFYADPDREDLISRKEHLDIQDEFQSLKTTEHFFQQLMYLLNDFNSIYLYISKDKNYSFVLKGRNKLGYDPTSEAWFQSTLAARGKTVILPPHRPYAYDGGEVISFSRVLYNLNDEKREPAATILIDFTIESFKSMIQKSRLNDKTGVAFLDQSGELIYFANLKLDRNEFHRQITGVLENKKGGRQIARFDGEEYLLVYNTSSVTQWKVLTLTPYSEVARDGKKLLFFHLVLGFAALLLAIVIAYTFSRLLFSPIRTMQKGMANVKKGDFDVQLEQSSNDELGQLVASFNIMVATIKTLILEKYEETIARKDAEFKYLQAQINPHFMYNTLQIISSMAVVKKVPEINSIAKALAKILRYSIHVDKRTVTIGEEIQNLVCYLDIQKLRFKEFLNYRLEIEEGVCQYQILKLVLQPIVENCITHGIERKGAGGLIRITAGLAEGRIVIDVQDNGEGMSEEEAAALREKLESGSDRDDGNENHNNIGLRNINQRLKLYYGGESGLHIESRQGEGTLVRIRIPAIGMEEEPQTCSKH